jgi:hypothetical protein
MFCNLPPGSYGTANGSEDDNLAALATAMVSPFDAPKDGPDDEESGIPALYTYLGQFIDHDLTFDPEGSFQKQKDPNAMTDYRSPAFDLDNIYGRGPGDQPYMYADDGKSFLLGDSLTQGDAGAHDLLRSPAGRALIGDPRNDENAIVSQFQGLVHRFHNRVVAENPNMEFHDAQKVVRDHYQYVVLHDFLPRIIRKEVLDLFKKDGKYVTGDLISPDFLKCPFMPVEFSGAAYRFGHSMVRPGYRLNDATLLPIFPVDLSKEVGFPEGLTGFRRMISDWGIDWSRFIDIEQRAYGVPPVCGEPDDVHLANFKRLQFAYRIDTALVDPLGGLPITVAGNKPFSLALRNLERGVQFNLPTGQSVAKYFDLTPLADDQIIIGQGVDDPGERPNIVTFDPKAGPAFEGNCPLWTYVLAEAMVNQTLVNIPVLGGKQVTTPQLGPVGGRIVGAVFIGLMFADKGSLLNCNPDWIPNGNCAYGLSDFVKFALRFPKP